MQQTQLVLRLCYVSKMYFFTHRPTSLPCDILQCIGWQNLYPRKLSSLRSLAYSTIRTPPWVTPPSPVTTNQECALISHIPTDVMYARIAWDCWWKQGAAAGSSSSRLWRRVSLSLMHGTKRRDFTDEVICSNVEPSHSSASETTVLLRYLSLFINCRIFGWNVKRKHRCAGQKE